MILVLIDPNLIPMPEHHTRCCHYLLDFSSSITPQGTVYPRKLKTHPHAPEKHFLSSVKLRRETLGQHSVDIDRQCLRRGIVPPVVPARLRRRHAQQSHMCDAHVHVVIRKGTHHAQHRTIVCELDDRCSLLDDRHAVVKVEAPRSFAVQAGRDDEVEVDLATSCGRVGALLAHRNDGAAFDVHWDLGEVNVGQGDAGSGAADGLVGEEVVKLVVG